MSVASSPPTYEEAQRELKKLQEQGVSDSAKAAAETAATDKLQEEIPNLVEEIKALAENCIAIDEGFQKVYVELGKVDNSGFDLPKLQPQWEVFKNKYNELVWASRDTATGTEGYLLDFNEVVLPLIDIAIDDPKDKDKFNDAMAEINSFIERTNPYEGIVDGGDAEAHSDAFKQLSRDLNAFKDTFDTFANDLEGGLEQEIENIKGDIQVLTLEISKCDKIIMAMGIALGITVFATAAGAVAALAGLGPLGPAVAIGALIVGAIAAISELATLIAYVKKSNDLNKELRQKEAELKDLEEKLALLRSIQAHLEQQKSTIGDIAARIDRFTTIWGMIKHDAQLLRTQFENMGNSGSTAALKLRIGTLMKTYTPLKDGLKLYATTVTSSTRLSVRKTT